MTAKPWGNWPEYGQQNHRDSGVPGQQKMKKIRFPALILFLKRIVIVVGEAGFPFCNVIREAHGGTQGQCLKDYCMKYLVVLSVFLLLSGCKPDLENQVFGLIKNSNPDWRPNITEYRDSFIFVMSEDIYFHCAALI